MAKGDDRLKFSLEDARIIYRNFSGEKTKFNTEGKRNFHVVLPEELAQQMLEDGWNVKVREPREEGDDLFYHIQITVNYDVNPPRVYVVTSSGKTLLSAESVGSLDAFDIVSVDLEAVSYHWEVGGNSGITAYLKTLYAIVDESDLDRKYAHLDLA